MTITNTTSKLSIRTIFYSTGRPLILTRPSQHSLQTVVTSVLWETLNWIFYNIEWLHGCNDLCGIHFFRNRHVFFHIQCVSILCEACVPEDLARFSTRLIQDKFSHRNKFSLFQALRIKWGFIYTFYITIFHIRLISNPHKMQPRFTFTKACIFWVASSIPVQMCSLFSVLWSVAVNILQSDEL
jgi:hypothetical protein